MKKKILIICFSNLYSDPRPYRQIINLKDEYEITAVGYNNPKIDGVKFIPVKDTIFLNPYKLTKLVYLKLKAFNKVYWSKELTELKNELLQENYDLIIANDVDTLPLAAAIAKDAKIIFDAHEYAPKQFENLFFWKFFYSKYIDYLCKTYLPKVNRMLTVCEGIAQEYYKNYNILPEIFTNASEYQDIAPSKINDKIKIIHHGVASVSRKIENMIEMMDYLDERFTLDLMLVGNLPYVQKLMKKAEKNKRIKFIPPVRRNQIISFTNMYDIGVFLLEPLNFNLKYALPNKLFEYMQARLMIAIGPSLEMAKVVECYNCGVISDTFKPEDLAKRLQNLTKQDIMNYKNQSNLAAKSLNSENNISLLKSMIKELLDMEKTLVCAE